MVFQYCSAIFFRKTPRQISAIRSIHQRRMTGNQITQTSLFHQPYELAVSGDHRPWHFVKIAGGEKNVVRNWKGFPQIPVQGISGGRRAYTERMYPPLIDLSQQITYWQGALASHSHSHRATLWPASCLRSTNMQKAGTGSESGAKSHRT